MATLYITRRGTRWTSFLPVAFGNAGMGASRVWPSTLLCAGSMLGLHSLGCLFNTVAARTLATMSACHDRLANSSASVLVAIDVYVAGDSNSMIAVWNLLVDEDFALDSGKILRLPARKGGHSVTTGKSSLLVVNGNDACLWASIPAVLWTGMCTALSGARTRLRAINDLVQHFRMTFLFAGMPTLKTLATLETAASLR